MALINLVTNLKSLKFGKDRFGGGDSGQPFIKTPIDDDPSGQSLDKDFLLRGGLSTPLRAGLDTERLTRYFTNLKSPSGFLFVAKQNLLSQTAVRTQASLRGPNEGVYTPLSTLAQSLGGFAGLHVNKQGLNPFEGVRTYNDAISPDTPSITPSIVSIENNRLVNLYDEHVGRFSSTTLRSYQGGPGSTLGFGKTNIPFATDNRGATLKVLGNDPITPSFIRNQTGLRGSDTDRSKIPEEFRAPLGVTSKYVELIGGRFLSGLGNEKIVAVTEANRLITNITSENQTNWEPGEASSVYKKNTLNSNPVITNQNNSDTLSQEQISKQFSNVPKERNSANPGSAIVDFRFPLLNGKTKSTIMSGYNSYIDPKKTYEGKNGSRVEITSPGQRGNKRSYTLGKRDENGNLLGPVDKINAQPIYESKNVKGKNEVSKNDLVKFRIAAIDKSNPNLKQYMHFRAFIDNFSDAYSAQWSPQNYMGRGEPLYKYGSFGRTISMDFTVAAQSKLELIEQYKKLNFLASNLAPTYSDAGYMGGPLVTLTMGGWCYELPGFITALSLGIPQESPWEIGINDNGESDSSVKELPHIVKVSGLSFTPIHTFRPEKQTNTYGGNGNTISTYGKQRYLALQAVNNNYDS